jgi:hypothetical protein
MAVMEPVETTAKTGESLHLLIPSRLTECTYFAPLIKLLPTLCIVNRNSEFCNYHVLSSKFARRQRRPKDDYRKFRKKRKFAK